VNPLVYVGRWAFKFAVAYSVIATILALALGSSGAYVPDALLAIPFQPADLVKTINEIAAKGPSYIAVLGGGTMALFAVFNFAAALALGIPKLFFYAAGAVDPALIPFALLVGGFLQLCTYIYLLSTVVSSLGAG